MKEEVKGLQKALKEAEMQGQQNQTKWKQLEGIGIDSEEFNRVLGNMRWEGEQPSWKTVDFIKGETLDLKDNTQLLREVERLRLEKGDLACQLEKLQSLLKTQLDINREEALVKDNEITRMQAQLNETVKKADELSRKIEFYGGKEAINNQQIFDR